MIRIAHGSNMHTGKKDKGAAEINGDQKIYIIFNRNKNNNNTTFNTRGNPKSATVINMHTNGVVTTIVITHGPNIHTGLQNT